ncbi:zinc finger protein 62-like [Uloborus diversus]|uniref:zinc finger protein 62-like n=1 Tax=Uloborus diversus TaxID=327109 RepID=UPI0024098A14|nr:zinc finger protein 62-like [Uloborus diversus]
MSVESETGSDVVEQKLNSLSPSMQNDLSTDGDASTTLNNSLSNDTPTSSSPQVIGGEPKAKKRRKQSNPLKIQNATSPKFELPSYELEQAEREESPVHFSYDEGISNQSHTSEKNKFSDHASQKGSISRVTNALYNSKIKEAAKVNKLAIKSKESSLQSPTDVSSPESTEDVISNHEYKNSMQSAYSQLPPLLTMNTVDVTNDASKLSSIYNFSEFSSPVQQANINLPVSQRSFITSNGVRVFNPEAYCELCEKEFCNKYFLKTHKANKHGICSSENNSSGYSYKLSYKNMHMNPQVTQQMISQMCENGATFGSADSYCNICQKYFCNKYFLKKHKQNIHGIHENQESSPNIPSSIHVPVISPLPLIRSMSYESSKSLDNLGLSTKDEDSKINVSLENIKNSINCNVSLLNGSSPHNVTQNKTLLNVNQKEKKGEKYLCELCNIEFCDKFYLDSHRQNKHGSAKSSAADFPELSEGSEKPNCTDEVDESKPFVKGHMCAPCVKTFSSDEAFRTHMLETHRASVKEEDDTSRALDVYKRNGPCNYEKDTSAVDKSMQENSNSSTESGSFNCGLCFWKCKDKSNFLAHMESEHYIFAPAGSDLTNASSESVLSCDSCHEQFPDHLTLMSHKYKVHGIISSGLEALVENFENGDYMFNSGGRSKSGSSFCQICNKELCNKYFMKTHMLKMHGIDVDKIQQERLATSTAGVYCDICEKFLCSKYFLKVHKQNVHGISDDVSKISMVGSPSYSSNVNEKKVEKLTGNGSQTPNNVSPDELANKEDKQNSVFACDICGQEFLSKLMLQVHLVEKHVKCYETKAFSGIDVNSFSHLTEDSKESGVLPCSCCSYVNLDENLKLSQVSSHIRMISCIVCSMTYHQNDYYTHHLSHGTSLPPGKKLPNIENGVHDASASFSHSGSDVFDPDNRNELHPRKYKRFRCSKCDKTFRTKVKCLNHIQVMHKSKKGLSNHCDVQNSSKKTSNAIVSRKSAEFKTTVSGGTENGSLVCDKESDEKTTTQGSSFNDSVKLPVPYILPSNSDVIMQPFHLSEPKSEGVTKQDIFVPSLVYLPVSQKVSEPVTVAFTLTPA